MPNYDYKCRKCRFKDEFYTRVDEKATCPKCGTEMERLITRRFNINPDLEPYIEENLCEEPVLVKSHQHRRELMKKYGVVEKIGKGWQ